MRYLLRTTKFTHAHFHRCLAIQFALVRFNKFKKKELFTVVIFFSHRIKYFNNVIYNASKWRWNNNSIIQTGVQCVNRKWIDRYMKIIILKKFIHLYCLNMTRVEAYYLTLHRCCCYYCFFMAHFIRISVPCRSLSLRVEDTSNVVLEFVVWDIFNMKRI